MLAVPACLKGEVFDHVRGVGSRPEGGGDVKNGARALDAVAWLG